MESTPPAQSILDTLRTVEFRLGLKGYNVDEVDEYLEKAAVEAEALHEQLRQMAERLRQASDRIAQLETERRDAPPASEAAAPVEVVTDDTLQRTLLLAQRFVDQTKRESEAEASRVVAQAEEHARATVAQADEEARRRSNDAEQRLREEVARLEAMRGQLASDVEGMGRHLESERNRIRNALTDVLKWVDENVQPVSTSPGPTRPRATAPDAPRPVAPAPIAAPAVTGSPGAPQGSSASVSSDSAARATPARPAAVPASTGADDPSGETDTVAQVLDLRGAASGTPPADRN
jgi:cell division initiation protein